MRVRHRPPLSVQLLALVQAISPGLRGRWRLLRAARWLAARHSCCFPWTMKNGLRVGVTSLEAVSPGGVGAVCFRNREWEPHVEACLRRFLRPGSTALDLGANLGYFSAVMAQAVGPTGSVHAFEPTPTTVQQLQLTRDANRFAHLQVHALGLGAAPGTAQIHFDPTFSGNASLYHREANSGVTAEIRLETLDRLHAAGTVPAASFVKMDVEGHELAAIAGGAGYLRRHRPHILYEYNTETAGLAGFDLRQLRGAIDALGAYEHHLVWTDGNLMRLKEDGLEFAPGSYVDILAIPQP